MNSGAPFTNSSPHPDRAASHQVEGAWSKSENLAVKRQPLAVVKEALRRGVRRRTG